ncbi:MAG TPA: Na/Pi cotransporter family protein, partial [Bacteroidales bacterium]|nr:Na/Pi cotransporter family protein [Bacteroidales bacterium]
LVYTNSHGICGTAFTLGSHTGEYHVTASIVSNTPHNTLSYSFEAKASYWLFFMLIGVVGGLVFFLYGMNIMSSGLQKTAGDKMRTILSSLTRNNVIGVAIGTLVTAIIQSSSATSVMLVSFVHSGLMRFKQTLSILLGATIGSTITVQLISFKLTDYSLLFVAIGGALYMFSKKNSLRFVGESLFGFGLLFFGMEVMSEAITPIKSSSVFIQIFTHLQNPFLGIFVGALFTAIVQSSAASIGIFIILATQGLLSVESSIALVLGANLGTPVTAIIASLKTSHDAKRVAITLVVYKLILVLLFVWFIVPISNYVSQNIAVQQAGHDLSRAIANIHTFFNISVALVLFPFIPLVEKLILRIKPLKSYEIQKQKTRYIDTSFINQPAIAMQLAKEETMRLSRKIQLSLELILKPFLENNPEYLETLNMQRLESKDLRDAIKEYLLKTAQFDSSKQRSEELFTIIHTLTELSHINDALTKILHRRAEKWIERNYEFTQTEREAILLYHANTLQLYNSAMQVFSDFTIEDALRVKKKASIQSRKAFDLEKQHYARLLEQEQAEYKNSKTYLELINMFKIIGEHAAAIIPNS